MARSSGARGRADPAPGIASETEERRGRQTAPRPLARPGDTCWRHERSDRIAFLIDGAAYFRALRSAIIQTRRSLLICGWELHSQLVLDPEYPADQPLPDGWPNRFCDLVAELTRRRKQVQVHVLLWNFSMVYMLDREILPVFRIPWKSLRRVHFKFDGAHPVGASHHQKIVVVDDRLAFSGGLDIAAGRWDTPEHKMEEPRRQNPAGDPYGPFHDIQMAVDGAAAAALGDLARRRWRRATGQTVDPPQVSSRPWPEGLDPDLEDIDVAIARTEPAYGDEPEVREVERLYIESIAAARHSIYIENQYFTCAKVGDALAESLAADSGPEIVVIGSNKAPGWLEELTMSVGRTRLLRRLREIDRHGRLAVYYPALAEPDPEHEITVHSKVMVVDDRLARVGSANLANRSMGLDTECDLAIEADGRPETAAAIAGLRQRLLAEHLNCTPAEVAAAHARHGSLIAAIEELRGSGRSLAPLEDDTPEMLTAIAPDTELIDPETPMDLDVLADRLLAGEADGRSSAEPEPAESAGGAERPALRRLWVMSAILLTLTALAAAWNFSPLSEMADLEAALAWAAQWRNHSAAPLLVVGAYVLGGLIVFPVVVMISVTGMVFGPVYGVAYALLGSLASASVLFLAGRALGHEPVRRVGGRHLNRISRRIGERGVLAVALLRLAPVAPFTLINMVAGASHIRFRDFLIGTVLGMAPGTLALVILGDRLAAILHQPGLVEWVMLLFAGLLLLAISYIAYAWNRRRMRARRSARQREPA